MDPWSCLKNCTEYRKEHVLPSRCSHCRGNDCRANDCRAKSWAPQRTAELPLRSQKAVWIIFTIGLLCIASWRRQAQSQDWPKTVKHTVCLSLHISFWKYFFMQPPHSFSLVGLGWGRLSYDLVLSTSFRCSEVTQNVTSQRNFN